MEAGADSTGATAMNDDEDYDMLHDLAFYCLSAVIVFGSGVLLWWWLIA